MQIASVIKFSLFTISTYFLTLHTLHLNTVPTLHLPVIQIGIYTENIAPYGSPSIAREYITIHLYLMPQYRNILPYAHSFTISTQPYTTLILSITHSTRYQFSIYQSFTPIAYGSRNYSLPLASVHNNIKLYLMSHIYLNCHVLIHNSHDIQYRNFFHLTTLLIFPRHTNMLQNNQYPQSHQNINLIMHNCFQSPT